MAQMPVEERVELQPRQTPGARVTKTDTAAWRLEIPAGKAGQYRLAQLDDYSQLPRSRLPWKAPLHLSLRARVSASELPGTWGFGFWNDPFSLSVGLGGTGRRFPALPRAAWFFYASPPNYLSFRDDLPAQGFLTASFAAPDLPFPLMAIGALLLPMAMFPFFGKLLRRVVRRLVVQGAGLAQVEATEWHRFALEWRKDEVRFWIDESEVFVSQASPGGRLGLVLWIDNQYAAWTPGGRLGYGFLANPQPAWLEIADFTLKD